jgi:hypothetical protein
MAGKKLLEKLGATVIDSLIADGAQNARRDGAWPRNM